EDFTYYFANSEQIPSAVGAGVIVDTDHSVIAAGGFIIQLMPGADEEVVDKLEKKISQFPSISSLIEQGKTPTEILHLLFDEADVQIHETTSLFFECSCSRERMLNAIEGMGEEEIRSMMEEDHGAEATCHFCNEKYQVTEEELEALLK